MAPRVKRPEKTYVQNLTEEQAWACRTALNPVCNCRCKGVLHGRSHTAFIAESEILFGEYEEVQHRFLIMIAKGMSAASVIVLIKKEYGEETDDDDADSEAE